MTTAAKIALWFLSAVSAVAAVMTWNAMAFSEHVYEPFGLADMVMLAAFISLLAIAMAVRGLMARRL
jgi:small neutral amino acid transporter SnatA (MarC family)